MGNEKIKQNEKDMRRIRRKGIKVYNSIDCEIIHTDTTSYDVIARINKVTERKSTGCLTEAMVIGY